MKHRMSCPGDGGFCACDETRIPSEVRRFDPPLPAPPRGMVYGIDTDYLEWGAMRPGSNFEVPSFRPRTIVAQIPFATGKSKKLYERAPGRAFYNACQLPLGLHHEGVRYDGEVSIIADGRLYQQAYS